MEMKLTAALAKTWQVDVTSLEHLEVYEKQGFDVSEWKPAALAKAQAAEAAWAEADAAGAKVASENAIDLSKLAPYIATPRDTGSAFLNDVLGTVLFGLGKAKKLQALSAAPLVYGAVVQANNALWRPGDAAYLPAVFVVALDPAHKNDTEWLSGTAKKIAELKDGADIPADMKKLIDTLRNDRSQFCFKIGASIAGGADAWCATFKFDSQAALPKGCLPNSGIVPFLLTEQPRENQFIELKLIPAKYYAA